MEITRERYLGQLKYCQKGKHKLRTNKFGVTWCVRCGLLCTGDSSQELNKDEILIIYEK